MLALCLGDAAHSQGVQMSLTVTLNPEEVAELRLAIILDRNNIRKCGYDAETKAEKVALCNHLLKKIDYTHSATYCPSSAVLGGTDTDQWG